MNWGYCIKCQLWFPHLGRHWYAAHFTGKEN